MACSSFRENVDLLGVIRSILENYPFSAGLLRELIQNSDDAKATEQVFVLDCRTHPSEHVWNDDIKGSQGPALLAHNNASFREDDWKALRNISRSSKKADTSKIGKFGIGIRSCYHITDFLQVLSGEDLVILDPQCLFHEEGGVRLNYKDNGAKAGDHFLAFRHFLPPEWNGESFDGTVVRLPLRTHAGELREKTVSPSEIEQLFRDFIQEELGMAMLFLQHLRCIDFIVINEHGNVDRLAKSTITVEPGLEDGVWKKVVRVDIKGTDPKDEEWLMIDCRPSADEAMNKLTARAGELSSRIMTKNKLRPHIGIAYPIPIGPSNLQRDIGQLFTFLRLPLATGFPGHVHAYFALTPSRQNLRNSGDSGVVKGSDDYILIQWNKLLFDEFIPTAWSRLLDALVRMYPSIDIFTAWPTPQSFSKCGESVYWKTFTNDVLEFVLQANLAVWPTVGGHGYYPLETVLVASPVTEPEVLTALANVGLNVCGPLPQFLFDLVSRKSEWKHRVLTPEIASDALRRCSIPALTTAIDDKKANFCIILEYLLSSGNASNVFGLPIIPTVSGQFVALHGPNVTPAHILLDKGEFEIFHPCDSDAIYIETLPMSTRRFFKESGPTSLNVQALDSTCILRYLPVHPAIRGIDNAVRPADNVLAFLARFWLWFDGWGQRSQLLPKLANIPLLPCLHGTKEADRRKPVFEANRSVSEDPALHDYLSDLWVPFLIDEGEMGKAKEVLIKYGLVKGPEEIKALLGYLLRSKRSISIAPSIGVHPVKLLLKHFNTHMPKMRLQDYSEVEVEAFRMLPIFPIVEWDSEREGQPKRRYSSVYDIVVYGVEKYGMLPMLPNTVFVDVGLFKSSLLPLLNEREPAPLSGMKVLELSIKRLYQQPKMLLAAILKHVSARKRDLTGTLRDSLRSEPFIHSAVGSLKAPRDLVDSQSPLHPLYIGDRERLPRLQDDWDRQIVSHLSAMGLLDRALSKENVEDRIRYIAATSHFDFSVQLLGILYTTGFDCKQLALDESLAWLPALKGSLVAGVSCRPGRNQGGVHDERLFDQVLERVHPAVPTIPPTLKVRLGWDEPIPFDILMRQLGFVLDIVADDKVWRVEVVIQELSKRPLEDADWEELKQVLGGRAWVPVSGARGDSLEEPWRAVFLSPFTGIYQVKTTLLNGRCKAFLRTLGCLDRPDLETANRRLAQLAGRPPSSSVTTRALEVLRFAVTLDLDDEGRAQLLVPDQRNHLRPIQEIVYNDVGSRALVAQLPEGQDIASPKIDDELARNLRLERLGLKFVFLQSLGEDMGVSPATVVQKTLAQYTEKQFLPEFLANAEDAGASTFEVILNDSTPTMPGRLLSDKLKKLYAGPSVMVCNDSQFTDEDFHGICRTHIGGKVNRVDTIGQFGLGALTMFHITECAFIFSGTSMLVLDPSKVYLPIPGRASLMLPLKDVIDLYPGHTTCLRGLSSFDQDAKRVNGTVFFLPLRSLDHTAGRTPLRTLNYTIESFQDTILRDFQWKAQDSLLFIRLNHIAARRRTATQRCQPLWSADVQRAEVAIAGYTASRVIVGIKSPLEAAREPTVWLVVSDVLAPGDVPDSVKMNDGKKSVNLGLAAPLNNEHLIQPKFFSMLPLAVPVALPVHVNASFKMSSDRRQIRLDTYDNDDTRFNRWLLTDQLPQLYLAQLELLAREGHKGNARWWPGVSSRTITALHEDDGEEEAGNEQHDSLASMLTEHFYKVYLPQSTRLVCNPTYADLILRFSEAIFYPSYSRLPPAVKIVLDTLRPSTLVTLPVVKKYADVCGAAVAGPEFIKQILMDTANAKSIREHLTGEFEMPDLLRYLATPDPTHLEGLELLQLEDGTWVAFGTSTTTRVVYCWPGAEKYVQNGVFRGDRFVRIATLPLELLNGPPGSVNVEMLTASALKGLVEEQVNDLQADPRAMDRWIGLLWQAYPTFPMSGDGLLKAIETLPLVPTMGGTSFKTLLQVKNVEVLLTSNLEDDLLRNCFQDLGIPVIDQKNFSVSLQDLVRFGEYSPEELTVFSSFLRAVSPILQSAVHKFRQWPVQRQEDFARWARGKILSKPEKHMTTAQSLPIWPSRKGATLSLRSARDLKVLPLGVSLDIGRFCQDFVADERTLTIFLGKEAMTTKQLYGGLRFNGLQEGDDEAVYKTFFQHLLQTSAVEKPLVPNAAREMVASDSLFERCEFFDAAFGPTSHRFLLPSFYEFARQLPLKPVDGVRADIFQLCATALQDDDSPNKTERGRIVYQKYHNFLPLHITSRETWQRLDHIRFIPRDMATTRPYLGYEIELPQRIRDLPPLVSPSKVVVAKYYPVAWTQRARLAVEPEHRLAMVYPDFGCPSGEEVIAHLRELKEMPHRAGVLQDLTMSYEWLNEEDNLESVASLVADMKDEPIFLNVNDPSMEEWIWCAASQLALESHDLSTVRAVRDYLKPFRRLLKAAGVLEAFYPPTQGVDQGTRESEELALLKQIRRVFNEQRLAGQLTDVVFLPDVKSEPEEGRISDNIAQPHDSLASLNGPMCRGHRSFLAGCSPTFTAMFMGDFREGQEATPNRPQVVKLPYPTFAIKTALDYLYTGEAFTEAQTATLDDFMEALGLADYLAVQGLFNLIQHKIMEGRLVDPNNVNRVQERAHMLRADALASWCDTYLEGNVEFISLVAASARSSAALPP